jgi:AraC family transcriptional regulator of adaptative response/methylated-DNA-[protein]-cysteine methyltransferase
MEPAGQPAAAVRRLLQLIEQRAGSRVTDADLQTLGLSPASARRHFKARFNMSFAQYQRNHRIGKALAEVQLGTPLTQAQTGAGYQSGSGFRDACSRLLGGPPSRAGDVQVLTAKWLVTPLGSMLAIACDQGIVMLDFVDRKGMEGAIARLRTRFAKGSTESDNAVIVPGTHRHLEQLQLQLTEYFAGTRQVFSLPLSLGGTPFERRAWEYLPTIPYGQTRSYGEQARGMGQPKTVRAVGRANGMNYLAILIPCHRVIGADGSLTGYGGGLARKRWLLDHERRTVGLFGSL